MIQHHPDDELLLAHAAGRLSSGHSLLVNVHAEACATCRERLHTLEALGGVLLDGLDPVLLAPEALASTLGRLGTLPPAAQPRHPVARAGTASRSATVAKPLRRPALPAGAAWPRSLDGCRLSRWRWLARGMRWSRITLPFGRPANLFVLRLAPGNSLPPHGHSLSEMTQVLFGSFDDGRESFGAGDFEARDGSTRHEPRARADRDCICLVSLDGKILFDGTIARLWGALNGI